MESDEQLQIASVRWAAIAETSDDAIVGKDLNGMVTSWNKGAERLFGYPAKEMIGASILRLIPADRRDEEDRILGQIKRGEHVAHFETLRQRKDGSLVPVSVAASPIKNAAGTVIGVSKVARDITQRKVTEALLLASEARYRTLFEYAPDGILIADPQGRYLDANTSICGMLGYNRAELIGIDSSAIAVQAEGKAGPATPVEIMATSADQREWQFRRKNGSIFTAEVFGTRMPDGNLLSMVRDVTGRKAAERSLRDSELRFETIFRSSPVAMGISRRRDMAALEINDAYLRILECTREQVIGKTILQTGLVDPATLRALSNELTAAGFVQNRELTIRARSGRTVHAILSVKAIELDGEACSLSILVDITERKLTEEKLRVHEAVLRETGQIAKVGGWSFEVATGEGYWTDEVARIHDLDPAARISKEIGLSYYTPESRTRLEPALAAAMQRGISYDLELEITSAAGIPKWIRTIGHPVAEGGKIMRLRGSFQDITERKRAELRLKLQNTVAMVLAEGSPLPVTYEKFLAALGQGLRWDLGELWLVDRAAGVLRPGAVWHPASTEFREFAVASRDMTFALAHGLPGRVWALGAADWSLDIARDPGCVRRELAGQLGLHGWIGFPIRLRNEILGVVGFFSATVHQPDEETLAILNAMGAQLGQFMERQQMADQFRQAQKMEAIGTLAGGVAHDFNNILAVIMGYTGLMKMTVAGDPTLLEYVNEVEKAGVRAKNLVRQILTFSRREESKREVQKLDPIVAEAAKFLRATIPAAVEITVALADDAPAVLADATQVHQIVMNLGANAWHAMKEQAGRLELRLEKFEVDPDLAESQLHVRPGSYARLSVSDTGKGMDRATVSRIFEPFFTTKGPDEGTGLGLSVVLGIMQGHDGAITVYSQPGEGTIFHLYFPAIAGEVADLERQVTLLPRGDGERILFVDDEEPLVHLAQKILARLGYRVETTTRATEALERVRAQPGAFDLVITDLTMPVMSGVDFAQLLAQIRPDLPVILTTGYPGALKLAQLRGFGIRELLLKPPSIQSLGAAVHRVLSERKSNSAKGKGP